MTQCLYSCTAVHLYLSATNAEDTKCERDLVVKLHLNISALSFPMEINGNDSLEEKENLGESKNTLKIFQRSFKIQTIDH